MIITVPKNFHLATPDAYAYLTAEEISEINSKIKAYNQEMAASKLPAGSKGTISELDPNGKYIKVNADEHMDQNGKAKISIEFIMPDKGDVELDSHGDYTESKIPVIAWSEEKPTDTDNAKSANNSAFTESDYSLTLGTIGDIAIKVTNAYEGDSPDKNNPNPELGPTQKLGGFITVDKGDTETVDNLVLTFSKPLANGTLQYKDAQGVWHDLEPDTPGGRTYTVSNYKTLHAEPCLRYKPDTYSDDDVTLESWSATITETTSGDVLTIDSDKPQTIYVDAVADKPDLTVDAIQNGTAGLTLKISAQFYDYLDDSESHYLIVKLPSSWAGNEVTGPGGEVLTATLLNGEWVIKIPVSRNDIKDTNGEYKVDLQITLPEKSIGNELKVEAWAEEQAPSLPSNPEANKNYDLDSSNNSASSSWKGKVTEFNPGKFSGAGGTAYEDNRPYHNEPADKGQPEHGTSNDKPGNGVQILGTAEPGEGLVVSKIAVHLFDTPPSTKDGPWATTDGVSARGELTYTYKDSEGVTHVLRIPFSNDGKAELTLPDGHKFDAKNLKFIPTGHGSGKLHLEMEVTVLDPKTNVSTVVSKDLVSNINVDAVATLSGEIEAQASGCDVVEIVIKTTFEDSADGSENHYVLLEAKPEWSTLNFPTALYDLDGTGAKFYYRIPVNESKNFGSVEVTVNGTEVTVKVQLTPPQGVTNVKLATGSYVEEVRVDNTAEDISPDFADNNFAMRPGQPVEWEKDNGPVRISLAVGGWAYENNASGTQAYQTEIYLSATGGTAGVSNVHVAGDVSITLSFVGAQPGEIPQGYFIYKDAQGNEQTCHLQADGTAILYNYDSNINNAKIVFVPKGGSDKDISISVSGQDILHYTENGQDQTASANPGTSSGTVKIDAVAEKPDIGSANNVTVEGPQDFAADSTYTIKNLKVIVTDVTDASESHYLLIEAKPDWEYNGQTDLPICYHDGKAYYMLNIGKPGSPAQNLDVQWTQNDDGSWTATITSLTIKTPGTVFYDKDGLFVNYGVMAVDHVSPSWSNRELTLDNNMSFTLSKGKDGIGIGSNPQPDSEEGQVLAPDGGGSGSSTPQVWADMAYENDTPEGNIAGGGHNAGQGAKIHLDSAGDSTSVTLSWDSDRGYVTVNGTRYDGPSVKISASDYDKILFHSSGYNDTDVNLNWAFNYPNGTSSSGSSTIYVDAVAQAPESVQAGDSLAGTVNGVHYGDDRSAALFGETVKILVKATFTDIKDGLTSHYILVQAFPGWQCGEEGAELVYVGDQAFFRIPLSNSDFSGHNDIATITKQITLKIPEGAELTNTAQGADGTYSIPIKIGAQSFEKGQDKELTYNNNNAITMGDTPVTVKVSPVDSVIKLHIEPGYENNILGYDSDGNLVEASGMPIHVTGLSSTDTITEFTISFDASAGSLTYMGMDLTAVSHPDIQVTISGGKFTVTIKNFESMSSNGKASLVFTPEGPSNKDVVFNWSCTVKDKFSNESTVIANKATGIVDAVAIKADISNPEVAYKNDTEAAKPNEIVNITFAITPDQTTGGIPYLLVQKVPDWSLVSINGHTIDLNSVANLYYMPTGKVEDGVFYRLPLDLRDINGNLVFVKQPDDSYKVNIGIKAPHNEGIHQDQYEIRIGSLVESRVSDEETDFANNQASQMKTETIKVGGIRTGNVHAKFEAPITESDTKGTEFDLQVKVKGSDGKEKFELANTVATENNETLGKIALKFTHKGAGGIGSGEENEIVGSIIYNGKVYFILKTGAETGKVEIDFGPNGYDGSKLTIIWGKVACDATKTPLQDGNGNWIVEEWNHAISDSVSLETKANFSNNASGAVKDRTTTADIDTIAAADAPSSLSAEAENNGIVVAGSECKVTVKAHFDDVDGSEKHFILVERPSEEWSCKESVGIVAIGDKKYFKIPVHDNTNPDPSVTITIKSPAGASSGSQPISFGGMSEETIKSAEGNKTAHTIGGELTLVVDGVNTTGVELSMQDTAEDGSSQMLFSLLGTGNTGEKLISVTLTLPKGAWITDENGQPVAMHGNKVVLDGAKAANGDYTYHPTPNFSGQHTLVIKATVQGAGGTAEMNFDGTGTIEVAPVTDIPSMDAQDVSQVAVNTIPGHEAQYQVQVQSDFVDKDGSEQHFFLIKVPVGIKVPSNWTVAPEHLADAANLSGTVYIIYLDKSTDTKTVLDLILTKDFAGEQITIVAGSCEKELVANNAPDAYQFSEPQSIVPPVGPYNIPPEAPELSFSFDTLRNKDLGGGKLAISPEDADGDTVSIMELAGQKTYQTDAKGNYLEANGKYGTLRVYEDGSYIYTLKDEYIGTNQSDESFEYTVTDNNGGTATGTIVIDLSSANKQPVITGDTNITAGGGNSNNTEGQLSWNDPEGDKLSISVKHENGNTATLESDTVTIVGKYGTLILGEDGKYKYVLNSEHEHMKGNEDFTVTVTDEYGASIEKTISIDIKPVNHNPLAENVSIVFYEKWTAYMGDIDLTEFDEDFQHAINNESISISHVNGIEVNGSLVIEGKYGTLTILPNGTYSYSLKTGVDATKINDYDSFKFTVKDSGGLTDDAYLNFKFGNPSTPEPTVPKSISPHSLETFGVEGLEISSASPHSFILNEDDMPLVTINTPLGKSFSESLDLSSEYSAKSFGKDAHATDEQLQNILAQNKVVLAHLFEDTEEYSITLADTNISLPAHDTAHAFQAVFHDNAVTIEGNQMIKPVEISLPAEFVPKDLEAAQELLEHIIKTVNG